MNFHILYKIVSYFVVGSAYHCFAQTICWFMSVLIIGLNLKIIFKFNNFRLTICAPVDKILWCVCVSWQIHTDPMRHYLCSPKCVKWMFYVNFHYQKNTKHQQHDKKNQQHRAKISDSMEWVSILIAFNFLVNLLSFFEFVNTTNIIFRSTWLIQWIYNKFKCWMRMEISWKSRKTRTKYVKSFYERKKKIYMCVYAPYFYNLLPSREQLKVLVANNHRCI